jgi:hypothetical protein
VPGQGHVACFCLGFFDWTLKFILIRMLIIPGVLVLLSLFSIEIISVPLYLFSLSNYSYNKLFDGGNFVDKKCGYSANAGSDLNCYYFSVGVC